MDALGAAHTNDTWDALTTHVLQAKHPNAELILRTLVVFVAIEDPPPQVSVASDNTLLANNAKISKHTLLIRKKEKVNMHDLDSECL